ncbi:hypothetical protein EOM09_04670 [bacterium]|nr:hypothetical protein [bacterium]
MEVKKEIENKLLERREIELLFEESVNLTKAQILVQIAKKFKVKENLIVIDNVKTQFGSRNVFVEVFIYNSVDVLNKLTPSYMKKRMEKANLADSKKEGEDA